MEIQNFKNYLIRKGLSTGSLRAAGYDLGAYLRWLEAQQLLPEQAGYNDILAYLKYLDQKGIQQKTKQTYLFFIRHYYEYLKESHRIADNPAQDIAIRGIKRKTLYHILTPEELAALYQNHQPQSLFGKRNKIIAGLLVYQGLKAKELVSLETKDINLTTCTVNISGSRKSNGRRLKLAPEQILDMQRYLQEYRPALLNRKAERPYLQQSGTESLLICAGGHQSHFINHIARTVQALKKINKDVENAKQLRASVIAKWLRMYNLREVQYMAGHRYVSSTEKYLQNDMEELKEEVQQFHPLG